MIVEKKHSITTETNYNIDSRITNLAGRENFGGNFFSKKLWKKPCRDALSSETE